MENNNSLSIEVPFDDAPVVEAQGETQQLSEDEVDLLMDALDDDDANSSSSDQERPTSAGEVLESPSIGLKYSFSLPVDGLEPIEQSDDNQIDDVDEDGPSEDTETEPASCSDEPPTTSRGLEMEKKKLKAKRTLEQAEASSVTLLPPSPPKAAKLGSADQDDWNEARAISHLMLSPYDGSFGLLSRVDTH